MEHKQRRKISYLSDNRGASIVVVIVVTALIGLFVSALMFLSLYNHQMRAAELYAGDTFYTADQALDEIRMGLIAKTSELMSASYMEVMTNADGAAESTRKDAFTYTFTTSMKEFLANSRNNTECYDAENLKNQFVSGRTNVVVRTDPDKTQNTNRTILTYDDHLTLLGLEVVCTESNGYVSIISTDINISIPPMSYNTRLSLPNVTPFALIAESGIVINDAGYKTVQNAGVYAGTGYGDHAGYGIRLENGANLKLVSCDNVISKGNIDIATSGAKAEFVADEGTTVWAENINVYGNGTNAELKGRTYVADDLTVYGNTNKLTLKGDYYGYGHVNGELYKDSALIINGTSTNLDFSGLNRLTLGGNAMIGDEEAYSAHGMDAADPSVNRVGKITTGESLAAKGEQIAYLAPAELVGVTSSGEVIVGANPMSPASFKQFKENYIDTGKGTWIDNRITVPRLNDVLFNYDLDNDDVYLYHDPNTGGFVYVYLKFDSHETAARFFREYYKSDHARMDRYISQYIRSFTINPSLLNYTDSYAFRLDVAGNLFQKKTGASEGEAQYEIISGYNAGERKEGSSYSDDDRNNEFAGYEEDYTSLVHMLRTGVLENHQKETLVFLNYVSAKKAAQFAGGTGRKEFFYLTDWEQGAEDEIAKSDAPIALADFTGKDVYIGMNQGGYTAAETENLNFVIANGDVYIERDFQGTVFTLGTIYLKGGVTIQNAPQTVSRSLRAIAYIPGLSTEGNVYRFEEFFTDGDDMTPLISDKKEDEGGQLNPEEMVTYSNWTRN